MDAVYLVVYFCSHAHNISVPKKTHFLISSSSYSQEDEKMGGCRIVVITIGIRITFNPVYLKVIF